MSNHRRRYALRAWPFVMVGCALASLAGVELAGPFVRYAGALFETPSVRADYFNPEVGLLDRLWSEVFWNAFMVPMAGAGMFMVAWPTLAAVQKWRPDQLAPMTVHGAAILGCGLGAFVPLLTLPGSGALPDPPLGQMLLGLVGLFALGAVQGIPAGFVLRWIALRRLAAP